jgi:hypothetical protein
MVETVFNWLKTYESVAIWLEGIALVLIFVWDRVDSRKQHEETLSQLHALTNTERAWVMVNVHWHAGAGRRKTWCSAATGSISMNWPATPPGNLLGTIDLMLTYVQNDTEFTLEFGDINEASL